MITDRTRTAPGPPGHFLFGHLREFKRDVLGLLLDSTRRYGDIVRFRLGPKVVHLLNHPDGVEHVLQKHASNYDKATRSARYIRMVCGESLLTSNGTAWQSQRKLLQPYFHAQSVRRFSQFIVETTERMCARWRGLSEPIDCAAEMMRLTYTVATQALFSAAGALEADRIEQAMQVILPDTFGRLERLFNVPRWIPTSRNRRFREALRSIDAVVAVLIDRHRRELDSVAAQKDLLGMLLASRDAQTGAALTPGQVRDQTITFLLAGHETTSNALTWTFYLLAQHPEVQGRIHDEVVSVLKGRPLVAELQLPFLRQVVREAMRLYPPIWIIERRAIQEDKFQGIRLPAGSSVVISPYTLHRHPAFWEDAEQFRPERFSGVLPAAYIPFGAGPRYCIGSEFAMLEAQLVIAAVVRDFRLSLAPGAVVEPWPGITLRTRSGLPLRFTSW